MTSYPLEQFSSAQVQGLCRTLWSWPLCGFCSRGSRCSDERCPWRRVQSLDTYLNYYRDITAVYQPNLASRDGLALNTHEELFEIINQLKQHPDESRMLLTERLFAHGEDRVLFTSDQDRVVNMAVAAFLMVNCSAQRQLFLELEIGQNRVAWRREQTLGQFMAAVFHLTNAPEQKDDEGNIGTEWKKDLTARRLKKHARLKFKPTNDLRNHLRLSQDRNIVEIFHNTAFLKEHLRLTKDQPRDMSIEDSLKCGALPRQLVLEVLDSIQKVLFPLTDRKSYNLLLSLVSSSGFDPDCTYWESAAIRGDDEKTITYRYFAARLADLYEELENPRPRGWIGKWVERKSGARYVMMATLAGVAFAVVLGIVSLGVECYSAWVGYQQWQHPVGH